MEKYCNKWTERNYLLVRLFLRKNEVVLGSLHTSRLEIFVTKVDGSYPLTVGLETFV